jgi:hypothetical protein
MRPSLALSIAALFSILGGLLLVLAPAQATMSAFGIDMPVEGLVPTRTSGGLAIGVGLIDWLAREAVGRPLRGLLWGNIFIRVADIVLNGWELAAGLLPTTASGGLFAGFVANIALIVMFVLALRRA